MQTWACNRRRRLAMGPSDDDQGFSLVEMIVAITIFLIVSVGLLGAIMGGLRSTVASEQRTRANEVAMQVIEGLRAVPWQNVGYYKDEYNAFVAQPGNGSPPYSESPVFIGATLVGTRPPDAPALGPRPVTVGPVGARITYQVTTWISWVGAANDGTKYAAKRVSTDVTWTAQGKAHALHAEGIRAPVASEMTPDGTAPAARILTATISPDANIATPTVVEHNVSAGQKTTTVLNFGLTTDIAAASATVLYTLAGSSTPTTISLTGSNGGKTWTLTTPLPVGSGPFDVAAPVPFLFSTTTATGETDAVTRYVTFVLPPAVQDFLVESAVTPTGMQLNSSNKTPAGLSFSVTFNRAAASAVVRYSTTSGPATDVVLTASPNRKTWTGTLAAGAGRSTPQRPLLSPTPASPTPSSAWRSRLFRWPSRVPRYPRR